MPEKHTSFEHVVGKGLTPEHKEKILKYKGKAKRYNLLDSKYMPEIFLVKRFK